MQELVLFNTRNVNTLELYKLLHHQSFPSNSDTALEEPLFPWRVFLTSKDLRELPDSVLSELLSLESLWPHTRWTSARHNRSPNVRHEPGIARHSSLKTRPLWMGNQLHPFFPQTVPKVKSFSSLTLHLGQSWYWRQKKVLGPSRGYSHQSTGIGKAVLWLSMSCPLDIVPPLLLEWESSNFRGSFCSSADVNQPA